MYKIGFDTTGHPDHINSATATGMTAVAHPILAAFAALITGATINATTAGRIPRNMLSTVALVLMKSGVRNIAMARMMRNEGKIVPNAATTLPRVPRSLCPTATEILTARMPGNDWANDNRSRNSSLDSHRW